MRKVCMVGLAVVALWGVGDARAQTSPEIVDDVSELPIELTIRTGRSTLSARGEVFDVFRDELGLSPSDFDEGTLLVELSAPLEPRVDLVLGGAIRRSSHIPTRAWAGLAGGSEVGQRTRLTVRPTMHAAVRLFAVRRDVLAAQSTERAPSANPYGVLGLGLGHYSLSQWGSFVDERTGERFSASFRSSGGFMRAFLGFGVHFSVTDGAGLVMEMRRDFGAPTLRGDFRRFETLDLSGSTLTLGVVLR